MRITVLARGLEITPGLRDHVERRLGFTIGWARTHVRKVTVRLCDLNGPRGGEDKLCIVVVGFSTGGELAVEDVDADLYVAIDRATGRADQTISRRLARLRAQKVASTSRRFGNERSAEVATSSASI